MSFAYTDHVITQQGNDLTCDEAIRLQKKSSKVDRLIFEVEDRLKEDMRLYLAIYNPDLGTYHYEPILSDGEIYYLIVGESITNWKGKRKVILIGVSPEFDLQLDNFSSDNSIRKFETREFSRIIVQDNFIDSDAYEALCPDLDYMLDHYNVMYENTIALSIQTAEDATKCQEILEQCETILVTVEDLKASCDTDLETCQDLAAQCANSVEICSAYETNCQETLAQNSQILLDCNEAETSCQQALEDSSANLNSCHTLAESCSQSSQNCDSALANCRTILAQIQNLSNTLQQQYESYAESLRALYESLNGGGGN